MKILEYIIRVLQLIVAGVFCVVIAGGFGLDWLQEKITNKSLIKF